MMLQVYAAARKKILNDSQGLILLWFPPILEAIVELFQINTSMRVQPGAQCPVYENDIRKWLSPGLTVDCAIWIEPHKKLETS